MSSPPIPEGYPATGVHDRSDREDLDEDHKYKRRRLEEQPRPLRDMTDPSRLHGIPGPPPPLHFPPFYGHGSDSFAFLPPPLPMNSGPLWEEDAALEYLASGTGFAQDLRGLVPSFGFPYTFPTASSANQPPPRPSEVTSHPAYQHPRPPPAIPFRSVAPDEFFRNLSTGVSDERLREVAGRVSEPPRHAMATQRGSNAPTGHEENRHRQPPYPATNEYVPRRRGSPPAASATQKPAIVLTLSRATAESIKVLEEHKRECPACQLEFEPGNYMAVITCCDTAMHVSCLSAWVNSQTYAKNRTCMKCRRSIDARRTLNNVVPPVNEKIWDEGGNFDAPAHLDDDARIELNVSARPPRPTYRRPRGAAQYTTYQPRGSTLVLPAALTAETQRAITRARQNQLAELEEIKARFRSAYNEQRLSHEENSQAQSRLSVAQAEASQGVPVDIVSLVRICEEKTLARDRASENFQKIQREMTRMQNLHSERMNVLIAEALRQQHRTGVVEGDAGRGLPSSEGNDAESAMSMSP